MLSLHRKVALLSKVAAQRELPPAKKQVKGDASEEPRVSALPEMSEKSPPELPKSLADVHSAKMDARREAEKKELPVDNPAKRPAVIGIVPVTNIRERILAAAKK